MKHGKSAVETLPMMKTTFGDDCLSERQVYRWHKVRSEIAGDWKLHDDNAPAHTAFLATSFLANSKVPTIPQPPYSADVAPTDFVLFPCLKSPMKGQHFGTVEKVKEASTKALKDILEKAYPDSFDAWKSRWKRCINAGGAYCETF